jgi:hypothetical protein
MDSQFAALVQELENETEPDRTSLLLNVSSALVTRVTNLNLVKYYISLLLKLRTVNSFKTLSCLAVKPDGVLAGITIAAMDVILGSDKGFHRSAVELWASWLPDSKVLDGPDLQGTLVAVDRVSPALVAMNGDEVTGLLINLSTAVPTGSNTKIIAVLGHRALLHTGEERLIQTSLQSVVPREWPADSDDWGFLFAWAISRKHELLSEDLVALASKIDSEFFTETQIADVVPIWARTDRVEDPNFEDSQELEFTDIRIPERVYDLLGDRISKLSFGLNILRIARNGTKNNRDFFKNLFPVIKARFSSNNALRRIGREAFSRISTGTDENAFIQQHAESVMDAIITEVRRTSFHDTSRLVRWIVKNFRISIGTRVDLIRCILTTFRPRDFPVWALEVLSALTGSLEKRCKVPTASEDIQLTPQEIIANEILGRVKYLIGTEFGKPQECFEKSVFAIIVCGKAVQVFGVLPKIQIVKLCEILDMMKLFLAPCGSKDEAKIRLLIALQLIPIICECDPMVAEFLAQRFEEEIWPLLLDPGIHCSEDSQIDCRLQELVHGALKSIQRRPDFVSEATIHKLRVKFIAVSLEDKN